MFGLTIWTPEGLKFDLDTCRCMLDENRAGESMKLRLSEVFKMAAIPDSCQKYELKRKKVIYSHI